jgi:anaerobic selenocysteine-containing dehydrogenase
MSMAQHRSYCRTCGAYCGTVVTTGDDRRVQSVRADRDHAMSRGYACMKGVRGPELYEHPGRLLQPLKRQADGAFLAIDPEVALDEIAARIGGIIEAHGARAIGCFRGTPATVNAASYHMAPAFMDAIGSPSFYTTYTIDQSAKLVAFHRMGGWAAPKQEFHDADVWLFAGNNIMVSNWTGFGAVSANPALTLKAARARGMKIIVVDPRRTETAAYADLHLQLKPGSDIAVAAAMLRVILDEGWQDSGFCEDHVEGLDRLRAAIEAFTPAFAAEIAGVPPEALREAASLFASGSKRGIAVTGTGPDMGPHSNLAEHLYEALNVVCGRYLRTGETVRARRLLAGPALHRAEVIPPSRPWETGPRTFAGNFGTLKGEMMSGALADEILAGGENRIRAMLVSAGNPANALPDQRKAVSALSSLDLLVVVDPFLSDTARLADYIFPPRLPYERPDLPLAYLYPFADAFAQYTPAIAATPEGASLVEDWEVFWGIARRLGVTLRYDGVELESGRKPDPDELLEILARRSQVPLEQVKEVAGGRIFDLPAQSVQPPTDGRHSRFNLLPGDVAAELRDYLGSLAVIGDYPFLLTSRRMPETMNSAYRDLPSVRRRRPYNPAHLHSADLVELGLSPGEEVWIVSGAGRIAARTEADDSLRRGTVSMSHGFGSVCAPESAYDELGSSTTRLVSTTEAVEGVNAMPRMTAIPVRIEPRRETNGEGESSLPPGTVAA